MRIVKSKQFVMSIAVVMLAVAFVFFQFLPLNKKARDLKAANAKLISENTISNAFIEAVPQLKEQIEKTKRDIGDFDAKIPHGRSHGIFLQNLAEVMQQQGLTELVIQPGIEVETSELSGIPIDIRCKGKLVQIFKFFKSLESFERVVRVGEITLTNDNKLEGVLAMNARVEIFYRTQNETAGK
jgi:Tfp pilus assembly protein PilO